MPESTVEPDRTVRGGKSTGGGGARGVGIVGAGQVARVGGEPRWRHGDEGPGARDDAHHRPSEETHISPPPHYGAEGPAQTARALRSPTVLCAPM